MLCCITSGSQTFFLTVRAIFQVGYAAIPLEPSLLPCFETWLQKHVLHTFSSWMKVLSQQPTVSHILFSSPTWENVFVIWLSYFGYWHSLLKWLNSLLPWFQVDFVFLNVFENLVGIICTIGQNRLDFSSRTLIVAFQTCLSSSPITFPSCTPSSVTSNAMISLVFMFTATWILYHFTYVLKPSLADSFSCPEQIFLF